MNKLFFQFIVLISIFLLCGSEAFSQSKLITGIDGHNSKQEIDIKSLALRVLTKEQKAIFKTNVVAIQGNLKLTSDTMTVYYDKIEKDDKEESSISLIETDGNVKLSAPGKNANSKKGKYDVKTGIITLTNKVVLTQGPTVIKGEKLFYDRNSGKSKVISKKDLKSGKSDDDYIKEMLAPTPPPPPPTKPKTTKTTG